jgi:hypothetical protein
VAQINASDHILPESTPSSHNSSAVRTRFSSVPSGSFSINTIACSFFRDRPRYCDAMGPCSKNKLEALLHFKAEQHTMRDERRQ